MRRSFALVRRSHPRRGRIARRMRAAGMPVHAICRALAMSRNRVLAALAGNALWSGAQIAAIRNEMGRVG